MVFVLTSICVISAFFLGLTHSLTADRIRFQEEMAEKRALKSVLPYAVDFSKETPGYYKGLNSEGEIVGYAFIGEGKGYSSTIRIMIGIDTKGVLQNIKIISQKETPGLGAKIEEQWFQGQFGKKEFDEIDTVTGATNSSKAVKDTVKSALEKFLDVLS